MRGGVLAEAATRRRGRGVAGLNDQQPSTTCARNVIHRRSRGSARARRAGIVEQVRKQRAQFGARQWAVIVQIDIEVAGDTVAAQRGMIVAHNASTALCRQTHDTAATAADKSAHHAYTASASRMPKRYALRPNASRSPRPRPSPCPAHGAASGDADAGRATAVRVAPVAPGTATPSRPRPSYETARHPPSRTARRVRPAATRRAPGTGHHRPDGVKPCCIR